jgi:tetratricopeptide (TPR) repeat protein
MRDRIKITIFLTVFFVYINSVLNPFIFDDLRLIVNNPFIKSFRFLKYYFTTNLLEGIGEKTLFYRPLHTLFYALIYKIFKLNPSGYHLLNIILHCACAILIFLLLKEIYGERISFLVSLLWGIHPVNSEAITYISGTADPLFLFFGLLGIYLYKKNFKILSFICFILSLLSKETSVLILPLFFLYIYTTDNLKKEKIPDYIIITSIFLIYLFMRKTVLNFGKAKVDEIFLYRFFTSFKAFLVYISILIFPFILSMERHIPYIKTYKDIDFISGFIYFLLFLYFLWLKRKEKKVLFAGSLFLINFIFHSNTIIPLNGNLREHWMYIGSIGFFIYFVMLIEKIKKEKLKIALTILIFSLYGTRTILRNYDWKDPFKFYEKSLKWGFEDPKFYYNLGVIYYQKKDYEKSLDLFLKSIDLFKDKKLPYLGIASCYANMGKYEEAVYYYKKVLEIEPDNPFALCSIATIYYNQRKKPLSEISEIINTCIKKNPTYKPIYALAGRIFYEMKNYKESIKFFKIAISLDPDDDFLNLMLGISYFKTGNSQLAEKYLTIAYNLNPYNSENVQNLAFFYKTTGKYDKAVQIYNEVIKLKPDDLDVLCDLGLCYAMMGEKEKAKNIWKEILNKKPDYQPAKINLEILEKN